MATAKQATQAPQTKSEEQEEYVNTVLDGKAGEGAPPGPAERPEGG